MITTSEYKEVCEALEAHLGLTLAKMWWTRPNRHFSYKTPLEVWNTDWHKVYTYVMSI